MATRKAPSHSARQTYLACARLYHLKYGLRLEPDRDPSGLRMGRAYAAALEEATKDDALDSLAKSYHHALGLPGADQDQLRLEHLQLQVLVPAYIEKFGSSLKREAAAKGFMRVDLEREVAFDDPLLGEGRIDAIVEFGTTRMAVEDKLLTAAFWRNAEEEQLAINAQVTAYFAAMREMGTPLSEMRYRVTLKPTIKPNSRTGETHAEYADRLRKRVLTEEGYAFREYQLRRTDRELDDFLERTHGVIEQMRWAQGRYKRGMHVDRAYPPNLGTACTQFGKCGFMAMCSDKAKGLTHTPGYRLRPVRTKLNEIQEDCLGALAKAFAPASGVRVADVARIVGEPDSRTRTALDRLVELALASKHRVGRAAVFTLTAAGRDWLA